MIQDSPTQTDIPSAPIGQPASRRDDRVLPLVLVLAALLTGALVVLEAPTPIRLPVVLAFLAMGPGLSIINLFSIDDIVQKLVLGLGLSIGLDTIIAVLVLYAGLWSPRGIMFVLVGITLAGAGARLRFTPAAMGFHAPAVPDTAPETMHENANSPTIGEAPTPGTDNDDQPSMIPIADPSPGSPKSANAEIERDVPPGRLARAMVFLGLVGGCIMIIARTSRRDS